MVIHRHHSDIGAEPTSPAPVRTLDRSHRPPEQGRCDPWRLKGGGAVVDDVGVARLAHRLPRIFERVEVGGLPIDWDVRTKSRRIRPDKSTSRRARIMNASIGGALIIAPTDTALTPGRKIRIGLDGSTGLVTVRWTGEADEPGMMKFGVSYADIDVDLAEHLMSPLTEGQDALADEWWTEGQWLRATTATRARTHQL